LSVDRKVLAFIKENPGANPREIADALGIPYSSVRSAILRLREAGYLIRSSKGGYIVRSALPSGLDEELGVTPSRESIGGTELRELAKGLRELRELIDDLRGRVERLEHEINILKAGLKPQRRVERKASPGNKLLEVLEEHGAIKASEAVKLAGGTLEPYIRGGKVALIGSLAVSTDFLNAFKKRFPLKVSEVGRLTPSEKELLDVMIREGIVYLHGGREYRIIE
jgi:DNA-binding MarR family transcriptional regulator